MKMTLLAVLAVLFLFIFLGLGGCGSDDPVDPEPESCSISVTSPTAGNSFIPGNEDQNTVNIRWDRSGSASFVMIELLKAGSVLGTIHPSASNSGFYRWTASTMGAANGSDFAIRVSALGESGCTSTSGLFTMNSILGCAMDFTNQFPDSLIAGEIFNLTWESSNTTGFVDIQLRKQDQILGYIASRTEDDGSFNWTVDSLHNGTYDFYYLRIQDSDVETCFADSVMFRMVDEDICYIDILEPMVHAIWDEGTVQNINISVSDEVSMVDLRLYTGNVFVGQIADNVLLDDFPYSWTVSDFDNLEGLTMYRVVAINSDDQYCEGRSGFFTINSQ